MDWVLSLAKDYPALVVGALAFTGVVIGLGGNGLLAWIDRAARRRHEHNVMRDALLAELAFLLNELKWRVIKMRDARSGTAGFNVPVFTATQVYDQLLDRRGTLQPSQGRTVVHAYISVKHLPNNLRRIVREAGNPELIIEDYINVPTLLLPEAIELHQVRISLLNEAISTLEQS